MEEIYNSELANELGNLVSRLTTIAQKDTLTTSTEKKDFQKLIDDTYRNFFSRYLFNEVVMHVWKSVRNLNRKTDEFAPWKKTPQEREAFLKEALDELNTIAYLLLPFIPETAEKIVQATQGSIQKTPPLFPKK
jgi:methionyl-tRNA synthetase